MANYYDATPYADGTITATFPTPPAPPFQAVPEWNPPRNQWGTGNQFINNAGTQPLSNSGDAIPTAFLVGPGTGHFGW